MSAAALVMSDLRTPRLVTDGCTLGRLVWQHTAATVKEILICIQNRTDLLANLEKEKTFQIVIAIT